MAVGACAPAYTQSCVWSAEGAEHGLPHCFHVFPHTHMLCMSKHTHLQV